MYAHEYRSWLSEGHHRISYCNVYLQSPFALVNVIGEASRAGVWEQPGRGTGRTRPSLVIVSNARLSCPRHFHGNRALLRLIRLE